MRKATAGTSVLSPSFRKSKVVRGACSKASGIWICTDFWVLVIRASNAQVATGSGQDNPALSWSQHPSVCFLDTHKCLQLKLELPPHQRLCRDHENRLRCEGGCAVQRRHQPGLCARLCGLLRCSNSLACEGNEWYTQGLILGVVLWKNHLAANLNTKATPHPGKRK